MLTPDTDQPKVEIKKPNSKSHWDYITWLRAPKDQDIIKTATMETVIPTEIQFEEVEEIILNTPVKISATQIGKGTQSESSSATKRNHHLPSERTSPYEKEPKRKSDKIKSHGKGQEPYKGGKGKSKNGKAWSETASSSADRWTHGWTYQ